MTRKTLVINQVLLEIKEFCCIHFVWFWTKLVAPHLLISYQILHVSPSHTVVVGVVCSITFIHQFQITLKTLYNIINTINGINFINFLYLITSNIVSSQKLTKLSNFSLSPPSLTTLCKNDLLDSWNRSITIKFSDIFFFCYPEIHVPVSYIISSYSGWDCRFMTSG